MGTQVLFPDAMPQVLALTNGPEESTDFSDNHGITHSRKVSYNKSTDPYFVATVYRVRVGGRKPVSGICWEDGSWKSDPTNYYRWDSNDRKWKKVRGVSDRNIRTSGTPSLSYFNITDYVVLRYGAKVTNRLKYSEDNYCFNVTNNFSGLVNLHYLE